MVLLLILFSVVCRKNLHNIFKGAGKFALTFVSYTMSDPGDAFLGTSQHSRCLADTVLFHIGSDGKAVNRLKNTFQGRTIDPVFFRQFLDGIALCQIFGNKAVDRLNEFYLI